MNKNRLTRLEEAASNFRNYTQSVAFQISLSRHMIDGLQMVRDWGMQHWNSEKREAKERRKLYPVEPHRVEHYAVPMMASLIRRGLVYHDYIAPNDNPPNGHRYYKLTRAGHLACELLVEAGLLSPRKPKSKDKAA